MQERAAIFDETHAHTQTHLPDCLSGRRSDRFSCSHCAIASESDLIALSYVSNSLLQDSNRFLASGEPLQRLAVSCCSTTGAAMITTIGAASAKAASVATAGHTQPRCGACCLNESCSERLSPPIPTWSTMKRLPFAWQLASVAV